MGKLLGIVGFDWFVPETRLRFSKVFSGAIFAEELHRLYIGRRPQVARISRTVFPLISYSIL